MVSKCPALLCYPLDVENCGNWTVNCTGAKLCHIINPNISLQITVEYFENNSSETRKINTLDLVVEEQWLDGHWRPASQF